MSGAEPQKRNSVLTQREVYQHWMQERIRWSDTDLVGHANNLAFGAFCETGRCHFVRELLEAQADRRAMLLPVQLTINFLGEAHWPATIDIGTGVISIGKTSVRVGQGLFDGDRCIGTSDTTIVLIDEQTRRPQPVPQWLRSWFDARLIVPAAA